MSLEEVIAAANEKWRTGKDSRPWNDVQADALREWLLADPQIERGARGYWNNSISDSAAKSWEDDSDIMRDACCGVVRAALSAILESPNREERA